MQNIRYIECSRTNSQTSLCKDKNIPGYPTWEINGKLFPGEQEIDELQDGADTETDILIIDPSIEEQRQRIEQQSMSQDDGVSANTVRLLSCIPD